MCGAGTLTNGSTIATMQYDGINRRVSKTIGDEAAEDRFGYSVAIRGETLVIGAYLDDDNSKTDSGSAYIYTYNSGTDAWSEATKLTPDDGAANYNYGQAVSYDGSRIAIASKLWAYVYSGSGANWTQLGTRLAKASGGSALVAIDGDTLATTSSSSGVGVYTYDDGWGAVVDLGMLHSGIDTIAGIAVEGDTVAVGRSTHTHDGLMAAQVGAVWVYRKAETGWGDATITELMAKNGWAYAHLGDNVAIDGDTIVAGAYGNNDNGGHAGSISVFSGIYESSYVQNWKFGETGNTEEIDTDGDLVEYEHEDDTAGDGGKANEITKIQDSATHVAHDAAGNMTKIPLISGETVSEHHTCIYDAWNRLIVIEDNDTEAPIATCEYDALGRRISKVVANSGAWNATYKYFYDGHQVVEVQNGSDVIVKQNVWGVMYVDELVQIGVNDDTTDGSVDTFYSVLADANYNIIGIMDSDGDLIERREYMPYGQRKVFKKAASGDGDYHCSEATSPSGASQSRPRVRADAGSPEKPRFIQLSAKAIHSGKRSQRPTSGAELA